MVSQGTVFVDGKPACTKCGRRPKRWDGKRWQSYCTECKREYSTERRAGLVEVLLTAQEWEAVQIMRAMARIPARGRPRDAAAGRNGRTTP